MDDPAFMWMQCQENARIVRPFARIVSCVQLDTTRITPEHPNGEAFWTYVVLEYDQYGNVTQYHHPEVPGLAEWTNDPLQALRALHLRLAGFARDTLVNYNRLRSLDQQREEEGGFGGTGASSSSGSGSGPDGPSAYQPHRSTSRYPSVPTGYVPATVPGYAPGSVSAFDYSSLLPGYMRVSRSHTSIPSGYTTAPPAYSPGSTYHSTAGESQPHLRPLGPAHFPQPSPVLGSAPWSPDVRSRTRPSAIRNASPLVDQPTHDGMGERQSVPTTQTQPQSSGLGVSLAPSDVNQSVQPPLSESNDTASQNTTVPQHASAQVQNHSPHDGLYSYLDGSGVHIPLPLRIVDGVLQRFDNRQQENEFALSSHSTGQNLEDNNQAQSQQRSRERRDDETSTHQTITTSTQREGSETTTINQQRQQEQQPNWPLQNNSPPHDNSETSNTATTATSTSTSTTTENPIINRHIRRSVPMPPYPYHHGGYLHRQRQRQQQESLLPTAPSPPPPTTAYPPRLTSAAAAATRIQLMVTEAEAESEAQGEDGDDRRAQTQDDVSTFAPAITTDTSTCSQQQHSGAQHSLQTVLQINEGERVSHLVFFPPSPTSLAFFSLSPSLPNNLMPRKTPRKKKVHARMHEYNTSDQTKKA
jgi:hypothetical protein